MYVKMHIATLRAPSGNWDMDRRRRALTNHLDRLSTRETGVKSLETNYRKKSLETYKKKCRKCEYAQDCRDGWVHN